MKSRGIRRKQRAAKFRRDLREGVTFIGELPYQHRGEITDTLYIWNARHPTKWVDRRDLPALLQAAGADNLDGKWIAEFKRHKAERQKEKEQRKQIKAKKTEEVAG